MQARGCDRSVIAELMALTERGRVAKDIEEAIRAAFSGVVLGAGVGLTQAQGMDDYADEKTCAAYREKDEKENWQAISAEQLNQCYSSLSFFDAEGMRFHLPAYLIAELNGDYKNDTAFALTHSTLIEEQFALLNDAQRSAVRGFLQFIVCEPDYEFYREDIQRALERYWRE